MVFREAWELAVSCVENSEIYQYRGEIMTIDTVEYAEKSGSEMYKDGATISDNPYDKDTQPELFEGWNTGFKLERDYWED